MFRRIHRSSKSARSASRQSRRPCQSGHRKNASARLGGGFESLESRQVLSANMLGDINPNGSGIVTDPGYVEANDRTYFIADEGDGVTRLWETDGTSAGTRRTPDLHADRDPLYPTNLLAVGDRLYFTASSGIPNREELWMVDDAGARLVTDLGSNFGGDVGYVPGSVIGGLGLAHMGDSVYFIGNLPTDWDGDGQPENREALIKVGPTGAITPLWNARGSVLSWTTVGDTLYFAGLDMDHGWELWRTDGTAAGTRLVKDINPADLGSWPVLEGSNASNFTRLDDTRFVFWADDGVHGLEPWISDGTAAGTELLRDIEPGEHGSIGFADSSTPATMVNGELYFSAFTTEYGQELWKTDGTSAGTMLVCDLIEGPSGSNPTLLTAAGDKLIFQAFDPEGGFLWSSLYRTDGTAEGTSQIADGRYVAHMNHSLTHHDGMTYFVGWDRLTSEYAIYRTDGTFEGTAAIEPYQGSLIGGLKVFNDKLIFTKNDEVHGWEPWTLDISPAPVANTSAPVDGFDGVRGQSRSIALYASDSSAADQAAGFTFTIQWGDGTTSTVQGLSGTQTAHTYAAAGSYEVIVTAVDRHGNAGDPVARTLEIHSHEQQGSRLAIGGTNAADAVSLLVYQGHLVPTLNGVELGVFTADQVVVFGQAGKDSLTIQGALGDDQFSLGGGTVIANGVAVTAVGNETLIVEGLSGNDLFQIAAGAPLATVKGGDGNDRFELKANAAFAGTLDGGKGTDAIDYLGRPTAVTVNLQTGSATGIGKFQAIESFVGGSADDTVVGANKNTAWTIAGAAAAKAGNVSFASFENLRGGSGADSFKFNKGASFGGAIDGGAGIDRLDYSAYTTSVGVDLAAGTATGATSIAGIEHASGGAAGDLLRGDSAANILIGNGGADSLYGMAGRDLLIGGVGADLLFGGADDDLLIGSATKHDKQVAALDAILLEWTGAASYADRIAHLQGTLAGGKNKTFFLKPTTVLNDNAQDSLRGEAAADWFFSHADLVLDLEPGELVS